ncbi:hypothetical protein K3X13_15435 (plasmid) [Aliiroseovarius crassostreae]|uniref:hypothetical protein n=1 Tax=Aliiroseovarius crassostreae TaxID=154981 RepID=UPI0021FED783|nr:hypothetical protein [Aliiroseovarius crassostreae]UWP94069.1 hypothetical protein K3X13_15435 [Aliiroseovarius crassostreae]
MRTEKRRLGLVLGSDELSMSYRTGQGQVVQTETLSCETGLRQGQLADLQPCLAELVDRFPRAVKRADVTLNVALPDPLFQSTELEFEVFPAQKKAADDLVAWQHAAVLDLDPATRAVGHVTGGAQGGITKVFAHSVSQELVTALQSQLWEHALLPSRIDALGSYLFAQPTHQAQSDGIDLFIGNGWWRFNLRGTGLSPLYFAAWSEKDASLAPVWSRLKRMVMSQGASWGNAGILRLIHHPERDITHVTEIARELGLEVDFMPHCKGKPLSSLVTEDAN